MRASWSCRVTAWLLLAAAPFVFAGCNAGTIGVVIYFLLDDDDDDGRRGPELIDGPNVVFQGVVNNRTTPSDTTIRFGLTSDLSGVAEVRVEYSVDGGAFLPMTFKDPVPGSSRTPDSAPGVLAGLRTNSEGVSHEIHWDATAALGGTSLARVTLRLTAGNLLEVPFLVGNDAPIISDVQIAEPVDGVVVLEIELSDATSDAADLAVDVSTIVDGAVEANFAPIAALEVLDGLPTSPGGERTTITWQARDQLGPLDRDVLVRIVARDLVGEDTEAASDPRVEEALLDLNSDPVVTEVIIARGDDGNDRRRGLGISFTVADREEDPVDVVVQWAPAGGGFPELPAEIDRDPVAREQLLFSGAAAVARSALGVVTLRRQELEGAVELPADGVPLEDASVQATWLLHEAARRGSFDRLVGRPAHLVVDGDATQTRTVCGYAPATGVLELNAAFDPMEAPGQRIALDTAGPLQLHTSADGARHHVIWASDLDIPGGGRIRVRVTPFDRAFPAEDDPLASCRDAPDYPLEGAHPGDRGQAGVDGGGRDLSGPFGERGVWTLPLAPVDQPSALAVADLDEDGRLDVAAVSGESRSLVLSFQTAEPGPSGMGSFDQLRLLDERIGDPQDVLIDDLDGDGDLDIAIATASFSTPAVPEEEIPAFDYSGAVWIYYQEKGVDFIANRVPLRANERLDLPAAIGSADLDGDGDIDLAVAESGGGGFSVGLFFREDGVVAGDDETDPDYAFRSIDGPEARDLEIIDFDGDGDSDIVVAFADSFAIFVNDGSGAFDSSIAAEAPAGADLRSLAVIDLDGNGELDLVGAGLSGGRLAVASQLEPGVFTAEPLTIRDMSAPVDLRVADVDGNGRDDLLVADRSDTGPAGNVTVCLSDASGGITCSTIGRPGAHPVAAAVGDLDRDGLLDIVSLDDEVREVGIYLQEAPGAFRSPGESFQNLAESAAPTTVAVADIDANGELDVLAASATDGDAAVVYQNEAGVSAGETVLAGKSQGISHVAVGDVDGDGRSDLVLSSVSNDDVRVRLAEEGDTFAAAIVLSSAMLIGPHASAIGDVDGDGRVDIVSVGRFSDTVLWFAQAEDGSFGEANVIDSVDVEVEGTDGPQTLFGPTDVVVEDINGDGRADIVVVGHIDGRTWAFVQDEARGSFTPRIIHSDPSSKPTAVAAQDVDGDGTIDLLVGSLGGDVLRLIQSPLGDAESVDLSGAVGGVALADVDVADVDSDGRVDIVATSPESGSIRVVRQGDDGAEPWSGSRVLDAADVAEGTSEFRPAASVAIDFDGDGEVDIVTINQETRDVVVFWGGR